jgi:hypothetical protein
MSQAIFPTLKENVEISRSNNPPSIVHFSCGYFLPSCSTVWADVCVDDGGTPTRFEKGSTYLSRGYGIKYAMAEYSR